MTGINIGGRAAALGEIVPYAGTLFDGVTNKNYIGRLLTYPGQNPLQLTTEVEPDLVENPVVAPDGSLIAYVRETGGGADNGIWTVEPDGANNQRVYDAAGHGMPEMVAWSPDSSQLIFSSRDGGVPDQCSVFVMPPTPGGTVTTLYTDPSNRNVASPTYSQDGTLIAFTVLLSASSIGLWVMDSLGAGAVQRDTIPTQFSALFFDTPPYAWCKMQNRLAWNDGTLAAPVWKAMDADGTDVTTLGSLLAGAGSPSWRAWLPDDSGLLVRGSNISGGATDEVWVFDAAGGGGSLFHDFGVNPSSPNLYVFDDRLYVDVGDDIYSVRLDGTDQRNEASGTADNLGLTG